MEYMRQVISADYVQVVLYTPVFIKYLGGD